MTLFALLAAFLVAVSLAFLLFPLLRAQRVESPSSAGANVSVYRDQLAELDRDLKSGLLTEEQYTNARNEIELRLLEDVEREPHSKPRQQARSSRLAAVMVGVALPLLAGLLYFHLGAPQALDAPKRAVADPSDITREQFESMTEKLAARMEQNPQDAQGWTMLGRAYRALERFPESVSAFAHAERLRPQDPEVLVEYAEAIGLARNGDFGPDAKQLLERALKLAPDDEKALTLAGTAAFANEDYKAAVRYWERLSSKVPADSELGQALASGIAEANSRMRKGGAPSAVTETAKAVSGLVELAPALRGRAHPNDPVFIFARAADGPPMPLAVLKKQVKDLPIAYALDDTMAMRPELKLSAFGQVVIVARISKSGNATPASGDLQGTSAPVSPGARNVAIVIDSQIP